MDRPFSSFPLFEQLYHQSEMHLSNNVLAPSHLVEDCKKIKFLDEEGHEILFLLIMCFHRWIDKDTDTSSSFPYAPKIGKVGYRYDITKLPPRLVIMISLFIPLHRKKMQDERDRYAYKD